MLRFIFSSSLLLISFSFCLGQGAILNRKYVEEVPHLLDRLEIKSDWPTPYHSTIKYYGAGDVAGYGKLFASRGFELSTVDQEGVKRLLIDFNEWLIQNQFANALAGKKDSNSVVSHALASQSSPYYVKSKKALFNTFYKTPAYLFEINQPYFHLRVFPLINIQGASVKEEASGYFLGRRGFGFRGGIDERIYFSFHLLETQARFPNYVNNYIKKNEAVPGEGFVKNFKSERLGFDDGYDFLNGHGYLGFNISKHAGVQLGFGRNFIGNGYRSLFLSDFSNNYYFLKLNWKVWRFHYQNIFAELSTESSLNRGNGLLLKKYLAAHYLNYQVSSKFNIGIFEAVVFNRENHFELQYLNPIVFYRTIEQAIGSPDNVLLGADFKYNLFKRFQVYGQLIFDEIKVDELFGGKGWWANKYGVQAGAKYIDAFGIPQLDLQVETNVVRPFSYSHTDSLNGYTHYQQALAHPLGANFKEWVVKARYQPWYPIVIEALLINAKTGDDFDAQNWGGNILRSNQERAQDYNNEIGQGATANLNLFRLDVSYQIAHRVYLDAFFSRRIKDFEEKLEDVNTTMFGGGIRVHMRKRRFDF